MCESPGCNWDLTSLDGATNCLFKRHLPVCSVICYYSLSFSGVMGIGSCSVLLLLLLLSCHDTVALFVFWQLVLVEQRAVRNANVLQSQRPHPESVWSTKKPFVLPGAPAASRHVYLTSVSFVFKIHFANTFSSRIIPAPFWSTAVPNGFSLSV